MATAMTVTAMDRRNSNGWRDGNATATLAMDSTTAMALDGTMADGNNGNGPYDDNGNGRCNGDATVTEGTTIIQQEWQQW